MSFYQYSRTIKTILLIERSQWVLWLPVALGLGIAVYFELRFEPPLWTGVSAVMLFFLFRVCMNRDLWKILTLAGFMVSLGFAIAQWRTEAVRAPILERRIGPVVLQGEIIRIEPSLKGGKIILGAVEIPGLTAETTPNRVRLSVRHKTQDISALRAGDIVRVRAVLRPPPPPAMPGSFDFQRRAYFLSLGAYGFVMGDIEKIGHTAQSGTVHWQRRIETLRHQISADIRAANPTPAGSVAAALLTGHRGYIPEQTLKDMRDAGIAHLLAISGLHIGLVAGIVCAAFRLRVVAIPGVGLRVNGKKIAAFLAIPAAFGYAVLAGFTVPTERALLMTCLMLIGVILDRRALTMRSVCWAALIVLIFSPESLVGPGFQMSFAAVTALIASYAWFARRSRADMDRHQSGHVMAKVSRYFSGVMLTSVIAGLATSPFAVYHFQHVALFGLITNAIAVPIAALWVMPAGVLVMIGLPFGLADIPLQMMFYGIDLILVSAHALASMPGAAADVAAPSTTSLAFVVAGGLWMSLWQTNWRFLGLPVFVIGLMGPLYASKPDIIVDGDARILAVGNAKHELQTSSSRRARFEAASWQRRLGSSSTPKAWVRDAEILHDGLRCDALGCTFQRNRQLIAIALYADTLADDCRGSAFVLALVPIRSPCEPPWGSIDRFDLWRYGTHAIYFDAQGPVIQTVNGVRGKRPWVNARE